MQVNQHSDARDNFILLFGISMHVRHIPPLVWKRSEKLMEKTLNQISNIYGDCTNNIFRRTGGVISGRNAAVPGRICYRIPERVLDIFP